MDRVVIAPYTLTVDYRGRIPLVRHPKRLSAQDGTWQNSHGSSSIRPSANHLAMARPRPSFFRQQTGFASIRHGLHQIFFPVRSNGGLYAYRVRELAGPLAWFGPSAMYAATTSQLAKRSLIYDVTLSGIGTRGSHKVVRPPSHPNSHFS